MVVKPKETRLHNHSLGHACVECEGSVFFPEIAIRFLPDGEPILLPISLATTQIFP
jgi:hypothetical protein